MKTRKCVICGAKVKNINPKTKTCSSDCTDKLHNRKNDGPIYEFCGNCGQALDLYEPECPYCNFHN